jgi:hypothetical protein
MAHRLAELMACAEKARTAAARESAKAACTDLILRLWDKRSHLPSGAPLAPFADFLENFLEKEPVWFSPTEATAKPKTWPQALRVAKRLLEDELQLWRDAALAAQPHRKARRILRALGDELGEDEARVLNSLAAAHLRYGAFIARMLGNSENKAGSNTTRAEREAAFRTAIAKVALQRARLLTSIGIRGGTKRRQRKEAKRRQ